MVAASKAQLPDLYEQDETAWLETMAELIQERRFGELDYASLSEYLTAMARRDKRAVENRLAVLLARVLKWAHQPERRSGSWRSSVATQRQKLRRLLTSCSVRRHALGSLHQAYADAVESATAETGLPAETFPKECPYTLEKLEVADLLT